MITIRRTEHFSWKSAFFQSALFLWTWLLLLVFCEKLSASPADIVPQGSALLDSFAALAQREASGPAETPEDFSGDTLYTRGQLARLLTHLVEDDPTHLSAVQKDAARATRHSAPAPRLCLAQARTQGTRWGVGATRPTGSTRPTALPVPTRRPSFLLTRPKEIGSA